MSDISALIHALVAVAQSNHVDNSRIDKRRLPLDAHVALEKWFGTINARARRPVASFASIENEVLCCSHTNSNRGFYAAQYTYEKREQAVRGWLIIQGQDVIGETADDPDAQISSGEFATERLPVKASDVAPDGTDVRTLLHLGGGSFAHFELAPGKISNAVTHRTIEEIWYFLGGRGEMWRKQGDREEIVPVEKGVCVTIPLSTRFQFRSYGYEPLAVVMVTMPPWPGGDEAYQVEGRWEPSVTATKT